MGADRAAALRPAAAVVAALQSVMLFLMTWMRFLMSILCLNDRHAFSSLRWTPVLLYVVRKEAPLEVVAFCRCSGGSLLWFAEARVLLCMLCQQLLGELHHLHIGILEGFFCFPGHSWPHAGFTIAKQGGVVPDLRKGLGIKGWDTPMHAWCAQPAATPCLLPLGPPNSRTSTHHAQHMG